MNTLTIPSMSTFRVMIGVVNSDNSVGIIETFDALIEAKEVPLATMDVYPLLSEDDDFSSIVLLPLD